MVRTGSFSALLCENSSRRAEFPGKLPRSILKAAIPVESSQVLMASYRSVPCVSPTKNERPQCLGPEHVVVIPCEVFGQECSPPPQFHPKPTKAKYQDHKPAHLARQDGGPKDHQQQP